MQSYRNGRGLAKDLIHLDSNERHMGHMALERRFELKFMHAAIEELDYIPLDPVVIFMGRN